MDPLLILKRFFEGRDFECRDSDLNESTKMWWIFSDTVDRVINFALREIRVNAEVHEKRKVKTHDFT